MTASEVTLLMLAPPHGWWLAGLFGALWGSFFNVAVHRLGRADASLGALLHPPSHCPRCGVAVRAYDNVPVLAWLWLRGRCRACHAPISIRYPLVEAVGAGLALAVYHAFVLGHPDAPALMLSRFLVYFFFAGTLFVLALIDLDTMLIPDAITLPAIAAFFVAGRVFADVSLVDALIGGALGYGALAGLARGYSAVTGREGLGGGDATLMALVGAFLGWRALPFTLGVGATIGSLVTIPILLWQRRAGAMQSGETARGGDDAQASAHPAADDATASAAPALRHVEVPFGPYLVAGALLYLFFKDAAWALVFDWVDVA